MWGLIWKANTTTVQRFADFNNHLKRTIPRIWWKEWSKGSIFSTRTIIPHYLRVYRPQSQFIHGYIIVYKFTNHRALVGTYTVCDGCYYVTTTFTRTRIFSTLMCYGWLKTEFMLQFLHLFKFSTFPFVIIGPKCSANNAGGHKLSKRTRNVMTLEKNLDQVNKLRCRESDTYLWPSLHELGITACTFSVLLVKVFVMFVNNLV